MNINSETMTTTAKDLTKEFPRSPRETLAGYVLAARGLDKCRAAIAGTLGEYHFDCPLDRFFFDFASIVPIRSGHSSQPARTMTRWQLGLRNTLWRARA